jgi:uncharacterized membrane protein/protein-disulfide isomerase
MTSRTRTLLLVFALLGLGAASASSYVHYGLLHGGGSSFCDVSGTVNCTTAYTSRYGSFLGIPVAIFGVVFFVVVLALVAMAGRAGSPAQENVPGYVFALSTVGLAFVLYLAYASYVQLKVFCILCAVTYVAVIAIFIISGGATRFAMTTMPRRASRDFRTLLKSPVALIVALVVIGGSIAAIALFPREEPVAAEAAQVNIPPLTPEERDRVEKWWAVQPKIELPIAPSAGVRVQIVQFSDYQCPGCRGAHDVFKMVLPKYDKGVVEFVLKHYPLEQECNPNVPGGNHYAACEAAAAYVMARGTGFQQKLDDWLFANQQILTREVVKQAAKDQAGITNFDERYAQALQEVRTDASMGGLLKVGSTPTVYINGRMVAGRTPAGQGMNMPPPAYIDALIDLELKRAK